MRENGASSRDDNRQPLVDVKGVKVQFRKRRSLFDVIARRQPTVVRAVDAVDLSIECHETLGLVGESGSGKTTLGRAILGLYRPLAGSIFYRGRNIFESDQEWRRTLRREVQMVFQDPYSSLNPRMTVRQALAETLRFHKIVAPEKINNEVERLAGLVGLSPALVSRYPRSLSGGQRQRVGVARALAVRPSFLVLDEPVAALDVSIQAQVLNLFQDLKKELGLTILFVAHELSVVKHMSNRIAVMYLGRIVELGPTHTIFHTPAHPYTRALMAAVPRLIPKKRKRKSVLRGEAPSPFNIPSGCSFRTRCLFAKDLCAKKRPLRLTYGPGHTVDCHFAEELRNKTN
jgi:oligopeptide transport system ATP-binding protein